MLDGIDETLIVNGSRKRKADEQESEEKRYNSVNGNSVIIKSEKPSVPISSTIKTELSNSSERNTNSSSGGSDTLVVSGNKQVVRREYSDEDAEAEF